MVDAIEKARHPEDEPLRGQFKNSILPQGILPGFGESLDDCDDFIPESMHFCCDCYDVNLTEGKRRDVYSIRRTRDSASRVVPRVFSE
ncbi:hypothetical protein ACFQE1_03430 [Halobium palmae]|uniref:Uncharacterized protein n=1 Tax=Halobium palmae TaxID=1776492 RepID=A0ABD5RVQ8_9EURY